MRRKGQVTEAVQLEVRPAEVQRGSVVQIAGSGWPPDAVRLLMNKEPVRIARVLRGTIWNGLVVPDVDGQWIAEVSTEEFGRDVYVVMGESFARDARASARLSVTERVRSAKAPRETLDKPYLRGEVFKQRRTGGRAEWPAGLVDAARKSWWNVHARGRKPFDGGISFLAPIHGVCNWVPLGPAPFSGGKTASLPDSSGRVRSLAIDPMAPFRIYAGTASGGVWRSTDGGETWTPRTDDKFSLAIGALAVDPTSHNIVYAGTGEYVPGSDYGTYYGNGLLKSTDFGETWSEIATATFALAEIGRIVVDPLSSACVYIAASNGLWESTSSGTSWTQLSSTPCSDVVLIENPMEAGTRRLLAGFIGDGVRTAADSGSGWSSFTSVAVTGAPINPQNIVFGVCRTAPANIYVAFSGPSLMAAVAQSGDWGSSWTAGTLPMGRIDQAPYNLVITPDPVTPSTVLLGTPVVWRSTDSGMSWADISFGTNNVLVHSDLHALVFNPGVAGELWAACDGGLYRSPDAGTSWTTRNLDLGTLQLYDIGQHPDYDAILIAGAQDNGGFHHSGAPIWKRSWVRPGFSHNGMDGDAVLTQIDPFNPYVHYYGTGPEASMWRSDDGGRFFSTVWAYFPGTQWWPAFACDPHTPGVIYTGGNEVMRSDARGDAGTWSAISGTLPSPLRAIGFHPTNPLLVYTGTVHGQVLRLTGPGAGAWTSGTVTSDDLTFTGLPSGLGISAILADAAGRVWVTLSDLIHTEGTGELTNNHVFRLDPGSMTWVSKSNGLVDANPINTIVADPADTTKLYCGGDRGVYAWNGGTETWAPMDEGLPNAPVNKLVVHAPSRKLRAATFGRGVWERSLDGVCSDYFLYVRDNLVDSGTQPSPDFVAHPYLAGEWCFHWQSPDIIVDSTHQTPAVVTSPIDLADHVDHDGAHRGSNRIYVTVHNKGPFAVTNVRVRVYFAAASGGLPPFPAGLLGNPFTWTPGGPVAWNPVGAAFTIGEIPPGTTRLAHFDDFMIPMSAERHSCLMTFVTSDEDPFAAGGVTDPDTLVVQNRKVALKNLDLDAIPGSGGPASPSALTISPDGATQPHEIQLHTSDVQGGLQRVMIVCGKVPDGAVIVAAIDRKSRKTARVGEVKLSRNAQKVRDAFRKLDMRKLLPAYDNDNLIVLEVRSRQAVPLAELVIRPGEPARVVVWMQANKWDAEESYGFDLVQLHGKSVKGGVSIRLAAPRRNREQSVSPKP